MRILFSQIALKRHICDVKNSQLGHDLPTSVNDSDFARALFSQNLADRKLCENKTLAKISDFTVLPLWTAFLAAKVELELAS